MHAVLVNALDPPLYTYLRNEFIRSRSRPLGKIVVLIHVVHYYLLPRTLLIMANLLA